MRLLSALMLHRDGMPMCEAAQCADVTPGWDAYMCGCSDVPRDVDGD